MILISNGYKAKNTDYSFMVDGGLYLLSAGNDITFLNNPQPGDLHQNADSIKLSNGNIINVRTETVSTYVTVSEKLYKLKSEIMRQQYIDNKIKPQIVKLEKEDPNYFIYTNRETNLIGVASKKILSCGICFVSVSTDGKKLFYIKEKSKTLTKPEDYAAKIEFYKKLTFRLEQ